MALSGKISAALRMTQTGANDFGGPVYTPAIEAALALADGTGANQADLIFCDQRTVSAASNDDIDLAGSLTGALGEAVNFAELVAIVIVNTPRTGPANTTNLTIGGGSNPFTGFLGGTAPTIGPIRPGGFIVLACGDAAGIGAVTAGTGDILRIANSAGAAASYQIAIIGRSA